MLETPARDATFVRSKSEREWSGCGREHERLHAAEELQRRAHGILLQRDFDVIRQDGEQVDDGEKSCSGMKDTSRSATRFSQIHMRLKALTGRPAPTHPPRIRVCEQTGHVPAQREASQRKSGQSTDHVVRSQNDEAASL